MSQLPRELLSNIFKYLSIKHIKTEILRWMTTKDIKHLLGDHQFEHFVRNKNLTGCQLYFKYKKKDKISWTRISKKYILSETFIRIYADKLDWYWISCKQKLTKSLVMDFRTSVDWWNIALFQKHLTFPEFPENKLINRLSGNGHKKVIRSNTTSNTYE